MIAPQEVMGRGMVQLPGHLQNTEVNEALMEMGMGYLRDAKTQPPGDHEDRQSAYGFSGEGSRGRPRARQCDHVPDTPRTGGRKGHALRASRARLLQTGNRLAQLRFRDGGEKLGTHNNPGAVNGEYRIETCSRSGCRINRYQRHDDPPIQTRKQVGLHIKQIPVTMLVTEHLKARPDSELSMARERQPRSLYI